MVGRMCSRPGGALLGVALSVCLKGNLLPERTVGVETSGITVNRHQAMRPQSQVTIVKTRATVDSQVALVVNNPPANTGDIRDTGSIPGSGRSPGGGHGNPLQYSCLDILDSRAWQATAHRLIPFRNDWTHTHTYEIFQVLVNVRDLLMIIPGKRIPRSCLPCCQTEDRQE